MTKDELRQARDLRIEIDQIDRILERLRSEIESPMTTRFSFTPKNKNIQQSEKIAIAIDLEQKYINLKIELNKSWKLIEKTIESLESTERILIRDRYIECKTWSAIAKKLSYDERSIYRLHGKILLKIAN